MKFFRSLFHDVQQIAESAADPAAAVSETDLEARLRSLSMLHSTLEFQWRKQQVEWESAASVEENLKRSPLMRTLAMRRAKSVAARMASIGRLSNLVEALKGTIEQTVMFREHLAQMKRGMGDNPAAFKALSAKMNDLMAQNREIVRGLASMQNLFATFDENADASLFTAAQKSEQTRLNELYEKLETCRAAGDAEGERKVLDEIHAITSGGASFAMA